LKHLKNSQTTITIIGGRTVTITATDSRTVGEANAETGLSVTTATAHSAKTAQNNQDFNLGSNALLVVVFVATLVGTVVVLAVVTKLI